MFFIICSPIYSRFCRFPRPCKLKMVGHQTLSSFFSSVADRKRRSACGELNNNEVDVNKADENENTNSKINTEVTPKKPKLCNDIGERLAQRALSPKTENSENFEPSSSSIGSPRAEDDQKSMSTRMRLVDEHSHGLVNHVGPSWFKALESQFSKEYFMKLGKFLSAERNKQRIFPPSSQVFSWTRMSDVSEVKVVILGQDPYHNVNQAHGFAFSVQKGVTVPPSLVNMYKELVTDIDGFIKPSHGDLTGWAKQGVLLLNAVLTVRAHQPNSHKDKGWEKFTDSVISYISDNLSNVVFILWGAYAQKKGVIINKNKHLVLRGPHPSPLSARKGFFGCKHFSKANEYLTAHKKQAVDWSNL